MAQFQASNFSTNNLLGLDITDPANPVALSSQAGEGRFVFNDRLQPAGKTRRYFITSRGASTLRRPAASTLPSGEFCSRLLITSGTILPL